MTKHPLMLLVLVGGYALALPPDESSAQSSPPTIESGPGPFTIDLDAASGNFEERFIQVPNGAFTVRGLIQFIAVKTNPKWAPLAAVELMGPKDSYNFGLIAFVLPKTPDKIEFAVRDTRLHGLPNASFARVHLSDLVIPFKLRLDGSGVLQVFVADRPGRVISTRPFEITRVRVSASTGHMRFSSVEITAPGK